MNRMQRRLLFSVMVFLFLGYGPPLSAQKKNIVVIICDDLNDAGGDIGGHPQANTPHMDAMQSEGVTFTNAQSNAPLCGPSRASLWSGLYPHTTGFHGADQEANQWQNNPVIQNADQAFEHFKDNGYGVYATGKIYHHDGWFLHSRLYDEFGIGQSFGPYPWDGNGSPDRDGHPDMPSSLDSWTDIYYPLSQVPSYPNYTGWVDRGETFHYVDENNRDLLADELNTEYAKGVFSQNHTEPFFLTVGYNNPHNPFVVPQEYYDMYPIDSIELAPRLENDRDDIPESMKSSLYWYYTGPSKYNKLETLGQAESDPDYWFKRWTQGYLACVSFVDHEIGKLMAALKASDYADNTIVILTSDHGYHMIEKDAFFKYTLWEESCRIPMVAWGQGIEQNKKCDHPVSLVDVYPTLLEVAGVNEPTQSLDGHSLVPFFEQPENAVWDGPSVALSSVADNYDAFPTNEPQPAQNQNYSVRSERYRYIVNNVGDEELYDHETDPHEWTNVACDINYAGVKAELRRELLELTGIQDLTSDQNCGYKCTAPSLGANLSICGQSSLTLTSGFEALPGRSFSWELDGEEISGAVEPTLLVTEPGAYRVRVDSALCATSDLLYVTTENLKEVELGSDVSLCSPAVVTLDATTSGDPTYTWTKNGEVLQGQSDETLEVYTSGNYAVSVAEEGCDAISDNVTVSSGIQSIQEDLLCEPGTAFLGVTSAENVAWYELQIGGVLVASGTDYAPSVSESTTYYVEAARNETGILADLNMDQFWTSDGSNGTWGQPFTLLRGATLQSFQVTVAAATSVDVSIENASGSTLFTQTYGGLSSGVQTLEVDLLLAPGDYFIFVNPNGTLNTSSNGQVSFPISLPGIAEITSTSPSWLMGNGRLGFVHRLAFGVVEACDRVPVRAVVDPLDPSCVLTTMETTPSLDWVLYPNPGEDVIYIASSVPLKVQLLDVSGRSVHVFALTEGDNVIDIGGLRSGTYFLETTGEGGGSPVRFVKQ